MTGGRRRFVVAVPDWGQDHLSTEAVAAYVDDELAAGPLHRAGEHLAACTECSAQVTAHSQARTALRAAPGPCLPSSLMSALRAIPHDTDLPEAPAGLAMSPDGQLVDVLRPSPLEPDGTVPDRALPGRSHRRMRIGATAAVSGLALGALAFGAASLGAAPEAATPQSPSDRGVFNGPVVGGQGATEASLRLAGGSQAARSGLRLDRGVRSPLIGP